MLGNMLSHLNEEGFSREEFDLAEQLAASLIKNPTQEHLNELRGTADAKWVRMQGPPRIEIIFSSVVEALEKNGIPIRSASDHRRDASAA